MRPFPPARLWLRDLAVLGGVAGLLHVERAEHAAGAEPSLILQIAAGAGLVLAAALLHEWGHLLGSLLTRSEIRYASSPWTLLFFDFDTDANDRRQFLAMSVGGYLGSLLGLALIAAVAPLDRLPGWIAMGVGSLGVIATIVIEMPTTLRVWRGAEPPPPLVRAAGHDEPSGGVDAEES